MSLHVEIVTPDRKVVDVQASEVRAPGFLGEFGVLPQHIPFVSVVRPGVVTLTVDGQEQHWVVGRGFVEAGADHVSLLTELAEAEHEVDREAAAKALHEAERRLLETEAGSPDHEVALHQAELNRARLSLP